MNVRRAGAAVLLVSSAAALAVLCWRGVYVRYNADDYWTASIVARLGFWKSQRFWYEKWSGRFAYTFVIGLVELIGPRIVPVLVMSTLVAWFAATFALLKRLEWPHAAVLAAAFVYAAAEGTLDVPQSILWQTGLLTYVAPIAGLTAWLATTARRDSVRWYDAIAPFVLAGFSETNTIAQILAIAALAFVIPRSRQIFTTALVASICGLIVVGLAPGNAVRMSVYHRMALPWSIQQTITGTAVFLLEEITRSGIALLVAFVAAALLAPRVRPRIAAFAIAVAVCTAAGTIFAAQTTLALPPPMRTMIVPHFLVIAAVAAIGAAVPLPERVDAFALPLLIVISAGPITAAVMRASYIPQAAAFARAWDGLDADLRRNRGREVVVSNAPGSVGTLSFIRHDPDAWSNRCISDYYSLSGIAAAPPGPLTSKLLEDLDVYATKGPRRHDEHNVVRLRFPAD